MTIELEINVRDAIFRMKYQKAHNQIGENQNGNWSTKDERLGRRDGP